MRLRLISAVITVLPIVSGCPAPYTTITRKAEASTLPDVYCLIERFREITPFRSVSYSVEDSGSGTRHSFVYVLSRDMFNLSFFTSPNRPVLVQHSGGIDNDHAERLPEIRAKLIQIEEKLRGKCGFGETLANATEECTGGGCKNQ